MPNRSMLRNGLLYPSFIVRRFISSFMFYPFNLPSPLGLTIYYGLMCGVSTCFQRFFGFFLLLRGFVVYNYVTWQKKRAAAIPPFSPWRNNHKSPLTRKKSNKPNQKGIQWQVRIFLCVFFALILTCCSNYTPFNHFCNNQFKEI